jgi:3-methylcrotonyl-CoA carboxylase alpha subunit
VWIGWAGRALYLEEEKRRATGRSSEAVHDEIRAPMTGKVVAIPVAAGEAVELGAVLVVLEAMKMEYRLTAPRAGVIEKIQCVEGELVDLGKAVVTLLALTAESPTPTPA